MRLSGLPLLSAILALAGLCILFFGYDAAVMSLVNINPDYLGKMDSNHGTNNDAARVGGLVSFWFLGFLVGKYSPITATFLCSSIFSTGSVMAGSYADSVGRLKALQIGCVWAILGGALLGAAENFSWMACARILSGLGCGHLNTIAPIWTSELADYNLRGTFVAVQFAMAVFGAFL